MYELAAGRYRIPSANLNIPEEELQWESKLEDELKACRGQELSELCHGQLLYLINDDGRPFIWYVICKKFT